MRGRWSSLLVLFIGSTASAAAVSKPRHVLMVVIDDLGFDDMGFRNGDQIRTPNFDFHAKSGIVLGEYYVQPSCSPTRATFMTGRKPVHTGINYWLPDQAYGLPLEEVTTAQVLNKRGFKSHAVGKWHLGFHKSTYTPTFRGFDSFYGYYEGEGDYFKHTHAGGFDMHLEEGQHCGPNCTQLLWETQGTYSTNLFSERTVNIIESHDASTPLFVYLAYQGVHEPSQAPQGYIDPYTESIADPKRRLFAGMLSALDEGLGNVTDALKAKGMYDETLIVVSTDNGGPTTECSTTGQSNWPYRGSKCSLWEGGTKGTGFVYWSGFPATVRGTTWRGLSHAADWLPTFVSATGGSVKDGETLPLDGMDIWKELLSNGSSPRSDIYYGISQDNKGPALRDIDGYKLILGGSGGGKGQWSPQQLPNASLSSFTPSRLVLQGGTCDSPTQGMCYPGGDIRDFVSNSSAECCAACDDESGCVAWTYRIHIDPPKCFLKHTAGSPTSASSCTSGPAPPADNRLLYWLPDDVGERHPLDNTEHADVIDRLQKRIDAYDATKVPQLHGDPSCPKFVPRDSDKGKWIGPYCDDAPEIV